jgi:membrane-associated protease RseP (regulator of RpoE activity)
MDDVLEPPRPRARFPAANVALFLATIATTLWAGFADSPLRDHPTLANVVRGGLPFAGSLIAILFTHEMGHYVVARRYGVSTSLPYFIPLPYVGFGTLGAVIRMRSAIPSRRAVLDIGAAGPLAGLAVALPLLVVGLALSEVRPFSQAATPSALVSPWSMVQALLGGHPLLQDATAVPMFGDSLVTWAARLLVIGRLAPGYDVAIHPIAFAAWIGLLVTALNLVPLGQLDGGHVLYALFGRRGALVLARIVSAGLLLAGLLLSWNWLVWWFLSRFVVGLGHPPALVEEPLDRGRRALAWTSLVLFVATFVPVPVSF